MAGHRNDLSCPIASHCLHNTGRVNKIKLAIKSKSFNDFR